MFNFFNKTLNKKMIIRFNLYVSLTKLKNIYPMKTIKNLMKFTFGVLLLTSSIAFANNNDPIKKVKRKQPLRC